MSTIEERIAVLETKVESLSASFLKHAEDTRAEAASLETKLDDLLALKNKGMGAVWLITALVGSGILGLISTLVQWARS